MPLGNLAARARTRIWDMDVKSSMATWSQGQNFRPRYCSIRPRLHVMLARFSRRLSSWPRCHLSVIEITSLRYVLLWHLTRGSYVSEV